MSLSNTSDSEEQIQSQILFLPIKEQYSENIKKSRIIVNTSTYANYISNKVHDIEIKNLSKAKRTPKNFIRPLKDYTLYEVIPPYNIKFYFDIENIPRDDTNFINNIIRDIKEYVFKKTGIKFTDYSLTLNSHSSSHEGLSYHLVFLNYYTYQENIRRMVLHFLKEYDFYSDYIDTVVYSKYRLFKSANQINIRKDGGKSTPDDVHKIIVGTVEDSIIQNINSPKCERFNYNWEMIKSSGKNKIFSTDKGDKYFNSGRIIKELEEMKNDTKELKEIMKVHYENKIKNKYNENEINIELLKPKMKNIINENDLYKQLLEITNDSNNIGLVNKCKKWIKLFDENNSFGNEKQKIYNLIQTFNK